MTSCFLSHVPYQLSRPVLGGFCLAARRSAVIVEGRKGNRQVVRTQACNDRLGGSRSDDSGRGRQTGNYAVVRKRQRKYTIDKRLGCELRDSRSSDEREWLRADWTDYPHPDCILRQVYVESGRWWDR